LGVDESIKVYKNLYKEALEEITSLSIKNQPLRELTEKLMGRSF